MYRIKTILLSAAWLLSGGILIAQEEPTGRLYYGRYNWDECQAVLGFVAGRYCYLPNSTAYFTMSWIPGILDYPNPEGLDPNTTLPDHIEGLPCFDIPAKMQSNLDAQILNSDDQGPESVAPYTIDGRLGTELEAEHYYLSIKKMKCDGRTEAVNPPAVEPDPNPTGDPMGPPVPQGIVVKRAAAKAAESEEIDPGESEADKPYKSCSDSMHLLSKYLGYDLPDVNANDQVKWMRENWLKVGTMEQADQLAEQGALVIAGRQAAGNGHVTAIVTGAGVFRMINKDKGLTTERLYPNVAGGALGKKKGANGELIEIPEQAWSRGGLTMRDAWSYAKGREEVEFFTPPPKP